MATLPDLLAASAGSLATPLAERIGRLAVAHVADVMGTHVSTVRPDTPAALAGLRMVEQKVGCLPGVGSDGGLAGIVTDEDYLRWARRPHGSRRRGMRPVPAPRGACRRFLSACGMAVSPCERHVITLFTAPFRRFRRGAGVEARRRDFAASIAEVARCASATPRSPTAFRPSNDLSFPKGLGLLYVSFVEGRIGSVLLDEIVADAYQRALPSLTPRHVTLPWLPRKVDAIVGMRRAGKTWMLFQQMQRLVATGTPRGALLYVNFEDERLGEITATELAHLIEAHYRRVPHLRDTPGAFLFDEIQLVTGWERFIRRLVDQDPSHVCVTGSSAKLLSREIATSLRGRSLATELFPFSFAEALAHRGVAVTQSPSARERSQIEHAFRDYLTRGGFPEIQGLDEPLRVRVLQDYLDVVILRDLIERHTIGNASALRRFVRQLMNTPAGLFSVHKVYAGLKSQGLSVSKDSLYAWLDHVQDAYVFFALPIHTHSERVRQSNPRKTYAVDPGLVTACARRGSADAGQLLETAVFLELRRRSSDVAYLRTRSGRQVDFVSGDDLVQACTSLDDPATRDREVAALREAMAELGVRRGTIITLADTQELRVAEGSIQVEPMWRWALGR